MGRQFVVGAVSLMCFGACAHAATKDEATPPPLSRARQLLVSVTPDWGAVDGELARYERRSADDPWRPVGTPVPVVVGAKGMAWGRGLHGQPAPGGPVKTEGDLKSPAGLFALGSAFGYAPRGEAGTIKLAYIEARESTECVDDPRSRFYNRILDRSAAAAPDWTSFERMRRPDEFYRWGVVIDQNPPPVEAAAGSCVFLHIWDRPGHGTAGCTAMAAEDMEALMRWLDPAAKPVIVQVPREEWVHLRAAWHLP